jgi:hypothetical protein
VARLRGLPGIAAGDRRGCPGAHVALLFAYGYSVRTLTAPFGALQVFGADNMARGQYPGGARWGHGAAIKSRGGCPPDSGQTVSRMDYLCWESR